MPAAARFRYALVASAASVVIGVGLTVVGFHHRAAADSSPRSADVPLVATAPPEDGSGAGDPLDDPASADTGAGTAPTRSAATKPTVTKPKPRKAPSRITKPPTKKPRITKPPTRRPSTRKPSTPPATGSAILDAVLTDINEARVAAGRSALTIDADLSRASALHNQLMINGCGLSHQCPREESIGPRFSAQGVKWTSAGENIGFASSGSSQADTIVAANGLTASMLAERPPNDGHRKNLLSTSFKRIGLSVVRDGSGKTWMVQDFVK